MGWLKEITKGKKRKEPTKHKNAQMNRMIMLTQRVGRKTTALQSEAHPPQREPTSLHQRTPAACKMLDTETMGTRSRLGRLARRLLPQTIHININLDFKPICIANWKAYELNRGPINASATGYPSVPLTPSGGTDVGVGANPKGAVARRNHVRLRIRIARV